MRLSPAATLLIACGIVAAGEPPDTSYQASWIGNSYAGGSNGWVQMDCKDGFVTGDGRLISLTWYEEAHSELAIYGPPERGTRGRVIRNVPGLHYKAGLAVTADDAFIYVVLRDASVQRYRLADYEPVGKAVSLGKADEWRWHLGAATSKGRLYVTDWANDRVRILDTDGMRDAGSFAAPGPRKLTADRDGRLWIILNGAKADCLSPGAGATVACFAPDGVRQPVTIGDLERPTEISTDHQGRIVVADSGIGRNHLRIYGGDGRLVGTFGRSISDGTAGEPLPDKFDTITAAGTDSQGNWVVAWNGGPLEGAQGRTLSDAQGLVVRAIEPAGKLRWELFGLGFTDPAYPDPANEDLVYAKNERYRLDLSRPRGQQWTLDAYTLDRRRFPEDVRNYYSHHYVFHAARLDGRLFLLAGDQYEDLFTIYRVDGNTAVPCVMYCNKNFDAFPPNKPAAEKDATRLLWRDGSNGNPCDGRFQTGEYEVVGDAEIRWTMDLQMDARGDLWIVPWGQVKRLRYGGLDANGVPIYSFADRTDFATPDTIRSVRQLHYDQPSDTMYLAGFTPEKPRKEGFNHNSIGSEIHRYDTWSATPTLRSRMSIPCRNAGEDWTVSMAVAHPWVFAGERSPANIRVFDSQDGGQIAHWKMDASVGGPRWPGGGLDLEQAIRAFRRSSGEIQLFCEEVSYGKTMMHRWMPPGTRPLPVADARMAVGDGCRTIFWPVGFGGATSYRVERAGAGGAFVPIAAGILGGQYVDSQAGIAADARYRVIAVNSNGDSQPVAAGRTAVTGSRKPPVISIAKPLDGQLWQGRSVGSIIVTADATAVGGNIARVEFLRNGVVVASDDEAPFEHRFQNVGTGIWTFAARAIDDAGLSTLSAPVQIGVGEAALPPVAAITAPVNGSILNASEDVTITVAAACTEAIAKVVFLADGQEIGEDCSAPFELRWRPASAGPHVITARAVAGADRIGLAPPVGVALIIR